MRQQRAISGGAFYEVRSGMADLGARIAGSVTALVVLAVLLIGIVVFLIYRFWLGTLLKVEVQRTPVHCTKLTEVTHDVPTADNGRECTWGFWLCLQHPGMSGGAGAVLIANGGLTATQQLNKVVIAIRGKSGNDGSAKSTDVNIDYVPLQKWVHVQVVLKQYVLVVYVDGDVYSVSQIDFLADGHSPQTTIGGVGGPDAFVSRVVLYNYAASISEAQSMVAAGPVDNGILGVLGIRDYKLTWPVVKSTGVAS